jgi:hypothetical protein
MEFIMDVYRLIFSLNPNDPGLHQSIQGVQIDPKWAPWLLSFQGRMFKDANTGLLILRGFEVSLSVGKVYADGLIAPLNLRFIEQNPNKLDNNGNLKMFANLARQGHKIVWVINKDINNGFLGRVQDGQWEKSRPRVIQPAGTTQTQGLDQQGNQMVIDRGNWIDNIPDINAGETLDKVVFTEEGPAPWEE